MLLCGQMRHKNQDEGSKDRTDCLQTVCGDTARKTKALHLSATGIWGYVVRKRFLVCTLYRTPITHLFNVPHYKRRYNVPGCVITLRYRAQMYI